MYLVVSKHHKLVKRGSITKSWMGLYRIIKPKMFYINTTISGFVVIHMYWNACIAHPVVEDEYLSKDSEQSHRRLGFSTVGEFHQCAYKFGRWYNMIWMEKSVDKHS